MNITNGMVIFEGGNLTIPMTNSIMLTATNKVIDLSLANKLGLSVTLSNGVFSGSIREPGMTKSNMFKGVLMQDETCGYGYFLETNLSGRVLLLPATDASTPTAIYCPLAVGDSWTLQFTGLSYTQVEQITGTNLSGGVTWYIQEDTTETTPVTTVTAYDRNDAQGTLSYGPLPDTTPRYGIKVPLTQGNTWTTPGGPRTITQVGVTTTVPAGTFDNCLVVTQTIDSDPGLSILNWYAPDKGRVRQESWKNGELVDLWVVTAIVIK